MSLVGWKFCLCTGPGQDADLKHQEFQRERKQLLQTELGSSVFITWKDIITDGPPLSPLNFNHISLGGITPSCYVSWPNPLIHVVCFIMCTAGMYLFFSASR